MLHRDNFSLVCDMQQPCWYWASGLVLSSAVFPNPVPQTVFATWCQEGAKMCTVVASIPKDQVGKHWITALGISFITQCLHTSPLLFFIVLLCETLYSITLSAIFCTSHWRSHTYFHNKHLNKNTFIAFRKQSAPKRTTNHPRPSVHRALRPSDSLPLGTSYSGSWW